MVIGGSAVKETNGQLRRRGNIASSGPAPLTNNIMESLEGYLDNIAVAVAQTVAKGGPLAELAASLAVSVGIVARQQQEIKRLYEHINAMKNRGTQASSIRKMSGGVLVGAVCTHYEAVGRTAPQRKNACYFDLIKMTDRKYWAQKLMDEKGVACKDDG